MVSHDAMMDQALVLAARGRGATSPNPMVGAVVTRGDRIVGRGFHARAGGPHAEVIALEEAGEEGEEFVPEFVSSLKELNVENKGGKVILTQAQRDDFRNSRVEMLGVRKQLRDVQLALRKDIESLDTLLKIVNIWAVPLLVAILAVIMALYRRRRYNQQVTQG